MTATLTQARDEILSQFRTVWLADPATLGIQVLYDGVADDPPDPPTPFVRVSVRHNPSQPGQVTLANGVGQRRFRRTGFVFVQLFGPLGDGLVLCDTMATVARRAFEGVATPRDVLFRAVSVNEVGRSGGWEQVNVSAEFEYDEIV